MVGRPSPSTAVYSPCGAPSSTISSPRGRGGAARGDATAGARGAGEGAASGRTRYKMEELVPSGRVGREAFQAFLGYLYTSKLRPAPLDVVSLLVGPFSNLCRKCFTLT